MTWTEKYRPKKFSEIKGQEEAVTKLKNFLCNSKNKKKAVILYGPPGTGKTSLAYAAANEMNFEIFELNASDLRNKEKLKSVLKPAVEQKSLRKESKIILVDEVDGISEADYGGLSELLEIIDLSEYPLIITANEIWDKKFSPLRKTCEIIPVPELNNEVIKQICLEVAKKEGMNIDDKIITELVINAKGDLRAAVTDLQTLAPSKDYLGVTFDERNKETDIFNALKRIFKEKPTNELLGVFDSTNVPIDEIILWVEENIPAEYREKELARAYDLLSKTDIFKGRIHKQQYWRFLVYENIFLSYGISSSKKTAKPGFTSYKRPSRILQIWLNNQKIVYKKTICGKYAEHVHISQKRAMNEFLVIKSILKANPAIAKEIKLEENEIDYLMNK